MAVRFAPSTTGAFHLGNFRTAWVSHEWARRLGQPWVVRFEDIDEPRVIAGAQERQLHEMRRLGLHPDEILIQSSFRHRHWELFLKFQERGWVYPCFCSRKQVRESLDGMASAPHGLVPLYSGACRSLKNPADTNLPSLAWRLKMPEESGHQDFIIARTGPQLDAQGKPEESTFVPAYQWACAVDDYDGNYSLLVRAWDLESVLDQQRAIQKQLGILEEKNFIPPAVYHCALITQNDGQRLEKRTLGITLPELLAHGITEKNILEKFEKSFKLADTSWSPSQVFGEPHRSLKLSDLDF